MYSPNIRLLVFCLAVMSGWNCQADDSPQVNESKRSEKQTTYRNLVYATVGERDLTLDLMLPENVDSPPLLVWIHGGGWRAGSKKNPKFQSFVDDGYAVASLSYRFTDTAIFPAQIHDCKGAIRWLRAHQDDYGYDASWIGVGGSSAGGHLALLLGTSGDVESLEGTVGGNVDQSSRVQAVVDFFGPSDFVLRGKTQPDRAYTTKSGSFALLGGLKHGKVAPEMESEASPATYVTSDDPPLLIFHGTADKTVLLDQSERILELYQSADLPVELIVLDGAGHGGKSFFKDEQLHKIGEFFLACRSESSKER
ncbi:Carboxylesterase NlhH [Thalassoglobus neptunius]|uniref:Carboxylesterase NlhH n=1 Tax=Thalassoglobus neptunius TaxID=1938619 RepID=A0A5C5WAL6_9PLAN|nr:alpha/beta hydrolase [Thalassoglobus neptunius]TWT47898.1 Carboxylesterase NlhH [Thalassoglobus neptunius]